MRDCILVTGASGGRQGQTGRRVTESLLGQGLPVRAFVHRVDNRSERLAALGAEVFVGDLLDPTSVRRALEGVSRVYFAYPVQEGLLDASALMAVAARQAGVSRLVNLVMLVSSLDAPTPRMRQNYLSEQVFEWAGIGAVHVRATVFFENLAALASRTLAQGILRVPWGSEDTLVPLVAAEDVARVATSLLTRDSVTPAHAYPLIGEVMTIRQILAALARATGRDWRYQPISDEEWARGALTLGFNAHAVEHLSALWRTLRETSAEGRYAVTPEIAELGGMPPKRLEEFLRELA